MAYKCKCNKFADFQVILVEHDEVLINIFRVLDDNTMFYAVVVTFVVKFLLA